MNALLEQISNDDIALLILVFCVALFVFIAISLVLTLIFTKRNKRLKNDIKSALERETDLTLKLEEEESLKNKFKQKNTTKAQFIADMAADVKESLFNVSEYVNLAKRNIENPDEVVNYIEKIDKNVRNLIHINNKAINIAEADDAISSLNEKPFDLSRFITNTLDEYAIKAEAKSIDIHFYIKNISNPNVIADKEKLSHALCNVISNAVNFTGKNGYIKCTLEQETSELLRYGVFNITIEDNGCGMTQEFLNRIYQPFSLDDNCLYKEYQGTGLGMTIVKKEVDCLGGTLTIESAPGVGTKVMMSIPMRVRDAEEDEMFEDIELVVNGLKDKKVLLVEDDLQTAQSIKKVLDENGVKVDYANSGIIAVEKVKDKLNRNIANYYDFALIDIVIPDMDGYEISFRTRKLLDPAGVHFPIVAMSENENEYSKKKALKSGIDARIDKKITVSKLINVLAEVTNYEE